MIVTQFQKIQTENSKKIKILHGILGNTWNLTIEVFEQAPDPLITEIKKIMKFVLTFLTFIKIGHLHTMLPL